MNDFPETAERAVSRDGLKRYLMTRRNDGFFTYSEETYVEEVYWVEEDGSEKDVAASACWTPTHFSGLFDTFEAARIDALSTLPWLRDIDSTNGS